MSTRHAPTQAPMLEMGIVPSSQVSDRPWGVSSIRDNLASIPLSRDLRSVLYDKSGTPLTYLDLGRMGVSVHEAWDRAARNLLAQNSSSEGVEFLIRPAHRRLDGTPGWDIAHARKWMAHPSTFTVLHRHLHSLLTPRTELSFILCPDQEVAVYDCAPDSARQSLKRAASHAKVITYSLGFPVMR
ncbi:hypothetical protein [Corynebacterium cystitidis]|uniref:hypothetical protein n=1 Tax=Corynebacterium cystitidis TaxID=35757 RepID=UPI00211E243A|nr:hypothetical protein [Corynebacterium cystitidis]